MERDIFVSRKGKIREKRNAKRKSVRNGEPDRYYSFFVVGSAERFASLSLLFRGKEARNGGSGGQW